ncbi:MAG: M56 family metallopeptidase, partial [Corynebacterium sp.]|uniref:M56 family metallopeptidase n=1 Tax=Corynebacterium sp. TaxID=1720 RepID=UPI002649D9C3
MTAQALILLVAVGLALPALAGLMRLPRVAIGLIAGSVVAWELAALSIGPLLAWMVTGPDVLPGSAAAVCSQCLAAADPFGLDRVDTAVPVVLLLVVPVAVSAFQVVSIVRELSRRHRRLRRTSDGLRHADRMQSLFGYSVRVVDDAHPFALTLPRRHGGIVVSSGALDALSAEGLRAVLAHEDAHLGQRHHLITAIVTTITSRMRWVPLFAAA